MNSEVGLTGVCEGRWGTDRERIPLCIGGARSVAVAVALEAVVVVEVGESEMSSCVEGWVYWTSGSVCERGRVELMARSKPAMAESLPDRKGLDCDIGSVRGVWVVLGLRMRLAEVSEPVSRGMSLVGPRPWYISQWTL